jgi:hypothetical protein
LHINCRMIFFLYIHLFKAFNKLLGLLIHTPVQGI